MEMVPRSPLASPEGSPTGYEDREAPENLADISSRGYERSSLLVASS